MASKSIISRIYALARSPGVPPAARQALFDDLRTTHAIQKTLHRHKLTHKAKNKKAKLATTVKLRSHSPLCSLCKRPFPHRKGPDGRWHMQMCRIRKQQHASQRYWKAVGWDKLWKRAVQVRRDRALKRRTAIFKEIAPHAASILGDQAIENLANARRFGITRYLCSLEQWRRWVRRHYAR